jgi:hypothetical protein
MNYNNLSLQQDKYSLMLRSLPLISSIAPTDIQASGFNPMYKSEKASSRPVIHRDKLSR